MIAPELLARTDTYLNAEWRGSRAPWGHGKAPAPFVTISREAGSGGSSIARLLARKLNSNSSDATTWRVLESNLTTQMLRANELPTRLARFLPEDRVSEISSSIGELVGLHPSLWELVRKTNETIREQATEGHAIFVGRGANFATAGLANGVHVRLTAPAAHRARYVANLYGISEADALICNARCDAARRRYVRATFGQVVNDPSAYDLVINTGRVSLADAAGLIAARVSAMAARST